MNGFTDNILKKKYCQSKVIIKNTNVLLSKSFGQVLAPSQPSVQWQCRSSFPELKRVGEKLQQKRSNNTCLEKAV
jgi:hypothetical protein